MTYFTHFVQDYSYSIISYQLVKPQQLPLTTAGDLLDRGRSKSRHLQVHTGHRTRRTRTRWRTLEVPWDKRQEWVQGRVKTAE